MFFLNFLLHYLNSLHFLLNYNTIVKHPHITTHLHSFQQDILIILCNNSTLFQEFLFLFNLKCDYLVIKFTDFFVILIL